MTVEGIDVSHHQPVTPSLEGLDFLFARASIGLTADEKYAQHIGKAKAAGLVRGGYHFNWSPEPVADQARFFVAHATDAEILALDVEPSDGVKPFTHEQAAEFIDEVQRIDPRPIGLYHSESDYFDAGQDFNWVAKWAETLPASGWEFWQYTSSKVIDGKRIDADRFNGTVDELHALAGRKGASSMQISMVFSQLAWPGITPKGDTDGRDIDDCWAVSGLQAVNVVAPWLPLYGVQRYRKAAGNPDDPNVADGGTLSQVARGAKVLYPRLAPYIHVHAGETWARFLEIIDQGKPVSVAIDSSKLPAALAFGFKGRHQVTLVNRKAGGLHFANPLAKPYSRWLTCSDDDVRAAVLGYGSLVNGRRLAHFVTFPTDEQARTTIGIAQDDTPFDQSDIDAATAELQKRIDAAKEALG